MIENYQHLLEIFTLKWFEKEKNRLHPLYILNSKKEYLSEYFDKLNRNLDLLKKNNLLNKELKTKLKNPTQFYDTLVEIKVAVFLLSNSISDIEMGKGYPDIHVPLWDADIEVKNNNIPQKLRIYTLEMLEKMDTLNMEMEAVDMTDDPQRIWNRIELEILPQLRDKINIILINASPVLDYEEMKDFLLFTIEWSCIITDNKEVRVDFKGEFSKQENSKISSVVILKDGHYKGLFNPLNTEIIPDQILNLFNIERL